MCHVTSMLAWDGVGSGEPLVLLQTRALRFTGGLKRSRARCPVRVVWGERDRVALASKSRFGDELPAHAIVEIWPNCGHMVMWDRPDELVAAALTTTAARAAR